MSANIVPPFDEGTSLAWRMASRGGSSSYGESVCQSVARLTPNQSTLPSASTLVSHETSGYSEWRYLTSEWIRGPPKRRPKVASSAGPRFWLRNTSTGCSAKARSIQPKVASSNGRDRSMPRAWVPSVSPSGRNSGEPVMSHPPMPSSSGAAAPCGLHFPHYDPPPPGQAIAASAASHLEFLANARVLLAVNPTYIIKFLPSDR